MANISTGITGDANIFNLKEISENDIRPEIRSFMVVDEEIIQCFN